MNNSAVESIHREVGDVRRIDSNYVTKMRVRDINEIYKILHSSLLLVVGYSPP